MKLCKELNTKIRQKVWTNNSVLEIKCDLRGFQSLKPVDSRSNGGSINQTQPVPPVILATNTSQSVMSNTRAKVRDTLDLVASEVRQTKDSLVLSTTQAIKRLYL